MPNKDIFVHFPFFCFPKPAKKRKNGIYFSAFSVFRFFRFWSKTKKQKIEIYSVEFSIFPFLDENRKIGKLKFVSLEFLFSNFFTKWEKFKKTLWFSIILNFSYGNNIDFVEELLPMCRLKMHW